MKNVSVIMSTYNGEKYIREQIDSILSQKNVNITLYIRDDGSTDSTREIIREIARENENVVIFEEKNIGWVRSFLDCTKKAGVADFYAFSDQDDIWLEDKLYRAISMLEKSSNKISLYAGNVWVTDEKLNIIKSYCPLNENRVAIRGMKRLVLEDGMPGGLTYVFTPEARSLLLRLVPGGEFGHDYLLFRICLFFGEVIYDSEPKVLYRQHGDNSIGAPGGRMTWIKNGIKKIVKRQERSKTIRMLELFFAKFEDKFNESENNELIGFLYSIKRSKKSISEKVNLIRTPEIRRDDWMQTLVLFFKITFGML